MAASIRKKAPLKAMRGSVQSEGRPAGAGRCGRFVGRDLLEKLVIEEIRVGQGARLQMLPQETAKLQSGGLFLQRLGLGFQLLFESREFRPFQAAIHPGGEFFLKGFHKRP